MSAEDGTQIKDDSRKKMQKQHFLTIWHKPERRVKMFRRTGILRSDHLENTDWRDRYNVKTILSEIFIDGLRDIVSPLIENNSEYVSAYPGNALPYLLNGLPPCFLCLNDKNDPVYLGGDSQSVRRNGERRRVDENQIEIDFQTLTKPIKYGGLENLRSGYRGIA
jgi:hypothetical protein